MASKAPRAHQSAAISLFCDRMRDNMLSHLKLRIDEDDIFNLLVKPEHRELMRAASEVMEERSWNVDASVGSLIDYKFENPPLIYFKPNGYYSFRRLYPNYTSSTGRQFTLDAVTAEIYNELQAVVSQEIEIRAEFLRLRHFLFGLMTACKDEPKYARYHLPGYVTVLGVYPQSAPIAEGIREFVYERHAPPLPPPLRDLCSWADGLIARATLIEKAAESRFTGGVRYELSDLRITFDEGTISE